MLFAQKVLAPGPQLKHAGKEIMAINASSPTPFSLGGRRDRNDG